MELAMINVDIDPTELAALPIMNEAWARYLIGNRDDERTEHQCGCQERPARMFVLDTQNGKLLAEVAAAGGQGCVDFEHPERNYDHTFLQYGLHGRIEAAN